MKSDASSFPLAYILVFTPETGRKRRKGEVHPRPNSFRFFLWLLLLFFVLTLVAHQRRYSLDWVLISTLRFLRLCTSVPT